MNLHVDNIYIEDLRDDIRVNYDYSLYEFIDGDVIKAFYFGYIIKDEFETFDQGRQYLYSKGLRHVGKDIEEYNPQIKYWIDKYIEQIKTEEVDLIEVSEYVLNNLIYFDPKDIIKIALFLGLKNNE